MATDKTTSPLFVWGHGAHPRSPEKQRGPTAMVLCQGNMQVVLGSCRLRRFICVSTCHMSSFPLFLFCLSRVCGSISGSLDLVLAKRIYASL